MAIKFYNKKKLLFSVNAVNNRKYCLLLIFILASLWGYAQPVISSISPISGNVGTTVKITGSNFSSTAANNFVNFNGVAGTVTSASSTSLSVTVPQGANNGPISVSVSNKTAYSTWFTPTFSCGSTLDTSNFDKGVSYTTGGSSPEGGAVGDLDGDGYNDIVETNNSSNTMSIFLNKQKSGNFTSSSFASPIIMRTVGNPFMATIGDIDGDGKPDMVVGGFSTDSMYIYKNTSTVGSISFASPVKIQTTGNACRMVIADMDNDGLPDIVLANRSKYISIYKSSVTSSSFTVSDFSKTDITVTSTAQMNDVAVADMDGDGKMDFATTDLNSANLYTFINNGSLSFTSKNTGLTTNNVWGLSLVDIDGDGKPDITGAYRFGTKMFTFINTTSGGTFSLAAEQTVTTPTGSTILCSTVADMNGDGKPDFVGADLASKNGVIIVPNNSTTGSLSWGTPFGLGNKSQALVPVVSDLDGDGKPDIQIQDNSSKAVIFHNKSGVSSTITPTGSKTICKSDSFKMTGPSASGSTYQWNYNGSKISGATALTYYAKKAGSYTLTVTSTASGCSATSNPDTVVINSFSPGITNLGSTTRCQGDSLQLVAANGGTGTFTYQWRLNSATISGATSRNYTATSSGSYKVIITNQDGCVDSSSATAATFNTLPTASITPSGATTFCSGGSVTLNAPSGLSSYQWFNNNSAISGATSSSLLVSSSGSYTVKVTNSNGCSATSSATSVTVNTSPTASITAGSSTTFCSGGSVTLVAPTGSGNTYQWANTSGNISGATSSTFTASASSNYTVTVTNGGCSSTSSATTVTVNSLPTASISAGSATTFCSGGSVTLSAPTGLSSYQWINNGSNISGATSSTFSASASGSYQVMVSNGSGCSATSSATAVTVNANPTASVTAGSATTFCSGGSVSLVANTGTGFTYQWSNSTGNISGATSSSYSATTSESYKVTITNGSGCSVTSSATTVTVNTLPSTTISAGSSTTFCSGGSVTLSAPTGFSYQWWNNGATISGATSSSYSASATGSYQVVVTNSSTGCSATSSATSVTVNANPTASITAGGSTTICSGSSVSLVAPTGTGLTYQWSNSSGAISGATSSSYSVTATSTYSVKVTVSATGCSATSGTTSVTVNTTPTPTVFALTPFTTVCSGGTVTLSASGGSSYQWYNNGSSLGASGSTYNATVGGNYYVIATTSGCSGTSSSITVTVNPLPVATVKTLGSTTRCKGDSVALVANNNTTYSYQWKSGTASISGANSYTYVAKSSGSYKVIVTTSFGCVDSSLSTTVTINPLPSATISYTGATTFCQGGKLILNSAGSSTSSYQWYSGGSAISLATNTTYRANSSGSYQLLATDINTGCTALSSPVNVTVNPLPFTTVTASGPTTRCAGDSVILSTNNVSGNTYQWTVDGIKISGANSNVIAARASGNYKVIVTNSTSCTDSSAGTPVSFQALPSAPITSSTASVCQGQVVSMGTTAVTGYSYQWMVNNQAIKGATGFSYKANSTGTYTVKVINALGCSSISSGVAVTVNALPAPIVSVIGKNSICQGDSTLLTTGEGTGFKYQWIKNGVPMAGVTSSSFYAKNAAAYSVQVTNASGCTDTSAKRVNITINALPAASIASLGKTTVCKGGSVRLRSLTKVLGQTYVWMMDGNPINGAIADSFIATSNGNYSLKVTNSSGCSMVSAGIDVKVLDYPVAKFAKPSAVCQNEAASFYNKSYISTGNLSYVWTFGDGQSSTNQDPTHTYAKAGTYHIKLTVASDGGCVSTYTDSVMIMGLPSAAFSHQHIGFRRITFMANDSTASSYLWKFDDGSLSGGRSAYHEYKADTTYAVTLQTVNATGCTVTETDTIRVNTSGITTVNANNSSLKIYPNPYMGKTNISYTLDKSYPVSITVYDIMGREVMKQDNTTMMAGNYTFQFGGDKPGTYIVKAVIGNREYVQQIIQEHEYYLINK